MTPTPLSALLAVAAQTLVRVNAGESLSRALPAVLAKVPANQHAGAQDLSYHALRHFAQTEFILNQWLHKKTEDDLLALLQCALALLIAQRYPAHTLVDQAVRAVPNELAWGKKLVNAILRRYLREAPALLATIESRPELRFNLPLWWVKALQKNHPAHWELIASAQQQKPPLTLRVNLQRCTVEAYQALLAADGIVATPVGAHYDLPALLLAQAVPISRLPHFAEGWVSVQDVGAQLATHLLDLSEGMQVLDACAAPGGKTMHILESAQVHVTALDSDPARLAKVASGVRRIGRAAACTLHAVDARLYKTTARFDRILADLPCTASGIVRRHPDIPWLRRPSDGVALAKMGAQILDHLWTLVKPDGMLLMVTCSVWAEESVRQATQFAARHPDIARQDIFGQLLPGVAHAYLADSDGLFYARFWKNAA